MASFKQDHFHITNLDPRKAAQFYVDCLGAKIVKEAVRPDQILIDLDLSGIPLRITNSTGADANMGGLKPGFHHIALEVDDVDKAVELIKQKGAKIIVEPHMATSENKDAFFETSDGVVFELIQKKKN